MLIEVEWTQLDDDRHPLWADSYCLYAYLHPVRNWILYVGKADYSSVRKRLSGDHKSDVFAEFERRYGIDEVGVIHGQLYGEMRRTSQLLSDVASLLIVRLQPLGNIQSTASRVCRPGLPVYCSGDWPRKRCRFHDVL